MSLTLEQVRHVAQLARLLLQPEEEKLYQAQLSAILDAVAQLQSVDTTDVQPTRHADFGDAAPALALSSAPRTEREDVVQPSLPPERSLGNAPARVGTSFAVPKILE